MTISAALAIDTQGLRKEYKGVTALHGLNLRVSRHAICGFLGPNGAGKSTAIKLLLGLARPSGGSGTIFGHDIVPIRRRVGYLAQDPRYYEHLTARQTLRFVARFFYRGPAAAVERRIAETLDLVGLAERADRPIKGFSGGERQRLGIAQAQINQPELLILDEPAAALAYLIVDPFACLRTFFRSSRRMEWTDNRVRGSTGVGPAVLLVRTDSGAISVNRA